MSRSRTEKGELSRRRLLEAAAAEFADKGYHLARVSDIVRRAGLTQAAFYLYFPSKEAVYQELRQTFFARLWELAESGKKVTPLPTAMTVPQLRENVLALYRFFAEIPELTRVFLQEAEAGEELHRQIAVRVAASMRGNQEAGHVRRELSVEIASEAVVAILYRLAIRFLLTGEKTAEELADQAAALIARGIVPTIGQEEKRGWN